MNRPVYREPYHPGLIAEQDQAMERFAAEARRRPVLDGDPFILEEYLWRLGGIAQRAVEGFCRLHPELAVLERTIKPPDSDPEHDSQDGISAYENWIQYQGGVKNFTGADFGHTFWLDLKQETSRKTRIVIINRSSLQVRIDERQLAADNHEYAGSLNFHNCLYRPPSLLLDEDIREDATHNVLATFYEYRPLQEEPLDSSELAAEIMGDEALEIYREFGKVGLYRQALWEKMNVIVGSL